MTASRPFWIFSKFWNDGHYPRDIGKHDPEFQNPSTDGFCDKKQDIEHFVCFKKMAALDFMSKLKWPLTRLEYVEILF